MSDSNSAEAIQFHDQSLKRENTSYPLEKRHIHSLLIKPDENQRDTDDLLLKQSREIIKKYHAAEKTGITDSELETRAAQDDKYVRDVRDILADIQYESLSPVLQRVVASDLVALYQLLMTGGIDALYDTHTKKNAHLQQAIPQSESEIMQVKVELTNNYLENVRAKNREQEMAQVDNPVTHGLELEYEEPLRGVFNSELSLLHPVAAVRTLQERMRNLT